MERTEQSQRLTMVRKAKSNYLTRLLKLADFSHPKSNLNSAAYKHLFIFTFFFQEAGSSFPTSRWKAQLLLLSCQSRLHTVE